MPGPGGLAGGNRGEGNESTSNELVPKWHEAAVESDLLAVLRQMLLGEEGLAEAVMRDVHRRFRSLPKTRDGRVEPRAARYLVYGYFDSTRGWRLRGLEGMGFQRATTKGLHEVSLVWHLAPALRSALLGVQQSERGLSLEEVAGYIAALRLLALSDARELLDAAYQKHNLSAYDPLDDASVKDVLRSFHAEALMVSMTSLGQKDASETLAAVEDLIDDVMESQRFAQSARTSRFLERRHGYDAVWRLVRELDSASSTWPVQDARCQAMRRVLADHDADGAGKLPLNAFYGVPKHVSFRFDHSVSYLRSIGAIDNSGPEPHVLIANFVDGPSNCLGAGKHHFVCCVFGCSNIWRQLEAELGGPEARPEQLLQIASQIQSGYTGSPRAFARELVEKLDEIAGRRGGYVPLHGRLFAQWLHFAFPYECAYPHIDAPSSGEAVGVRGVSSSTLRASATEILHAMESTPQKQKYLSAWTPDEVLPLEVHEDPAYQNCLHQLAARAIAVLFVAWVSKVFHKWIRCGMNAATAAMTFSLRIRKDLNVKEPSNPSRRSMAKAKAKKKQKGVESTQAAPFRTAKASRRSQSPQGARNRPQRLLPPPAAATETPMAAVGEGASRASEQSAVRACSGADPAGFDPAETELQVSDADRAGDPVNVTSEVASMPCPTPVLEAPGARGTSPPEADSAGDPVSLAPELASMPCPTPVLDAPGARGTSRPEADSAGDPVNLAPELASMPCPTPVLEAPGARGTLPPEADRPAEDDAAPVDGTGTPEPPLATESQDAAFTTANTETTAAAEEAFASDSETEWTQEPDEEDEPAPEPTANEFAAAQVSWAWVLAARLPVLPREQAPATPPTVPEVELAPVPRRRWGKVGPANRIEPMSLPRPGPPAEPPPEPPRRA